MQQLCVSSPSREYPVYIGRGLLNDVALLRKLIPAKQLMLVTNATVAPLYLEAVRAHFVDKKCDSIILPDGEQYKNQQTLEQIYLALLKNQHHRDTTLVALGGGVIGDMTGFAASTYLRGVNFVQIPTTLLAQVDASVGGKTGINHALGKNMIGSFYQPSAVIMDMNTLDTLPLREFRAGIAEMIKCALLQGGELFEHMQHALNHGLADKTFDNTAELIRDCCALKAAIVAEDEREQGKRALLNLGHTLAHALETYTHYTTWLHGEAVAIGLHAAMQLSHEVCGLDQQIVEQVKDMLLLAKLPLNIPKTIDLGKLNDILRQDKKIIDNQLRFILMRQTGDCYMEHRVASPVLQRVLKGLVKGD